MTDDSTGLNRFVETFPALSKIPDLVHGFTLRNSDIDVKTDRDEALERLHPFYNAILRKLNVPREAFWTGEQIHGDTIFCAETKDSYHVPDTDGLLTATAGSYLGIFVADCAAVYLVDPVKRVCGLIHSGKKGTELQIASKAIRLMGQKHGSSPSDLIIQVSPCIRPPAYDVDFAKKIRLDCLAMGVLSVLDSGTCTNSDLDRYYSYRTEKGKTGRMLAILGFKK